MFDRVSAGDRSREAATKAPPQATAAFGRRAAYSIVTGKREFRIGTLGLCSSALILTAMTVWTAGTAGYFIFRDDLLTGLVARQGEMQSTYEDRISGLRSQIERLTSRQLLDQEQLEQRIDQLTRRQSTLESRSTALNSLPDSNPASDPKAGPRLPNRTDNKPMPLSEPGAPTVLDRQSGLSAPIASPPLPRPKRVAAALVRLEESLDRVEAEQNAQLLALEDRYGAKALRLRGVIAEIGLDLKKLAPETAPSGLGGPFVPLPASTDVPAFERQLQRVHLARTTFDRLSKTLTNLPVRKPINGEMDTSSGFGVRIDPFLRAPALHSGLDFRARTGEPVRATAAGIVTNASWSGGYGRMVEVDHGNGLSTRYGHLSSVLVEEGQTIKPGQVVGRVGSTGRSTGPHLHYETRIDGDAVDPVKFLRAGSRIFERPTSN